MPLLKYLPPRDLQTKATQVPASRDLQTRTWTNLYHIPALATRILHPKTNKETHYSLQAYDPHPCPTLRPPPDQNQISLKANEQSPMSLLESRYQDPPTPTSRQHCSHHVVSCFTGSITAIWLVSSDLHHRALPTVNADEPILPLSRWLQQRFMNAIVSFLF